MTAMYVGSVGGSATLNSPVGIDNDGTNIYFIDSNNNRGLKYSGALVYMLQFATGTQGSANDQLFLPKSIAVDGNGDIYITDNFYSRVVVYDSSGNYNRQWGSYGSSTGQFNHIYGIATDSSNNVYVVDSLNHRIQKFSNAGTYITSWGSYGSGDGQMKYPEGVTVDSSGNVYVCDNGNDRIVKFAP